MNKTFKIIVKSGTLSLPSGAVVFLGGDRLRQPRDGTMLDETPAVRDIIKPTLIVPKKRISDLFPD